MANALAKAHQLISPEEYLAGERSSEIRHEYVGGHVYAMAGASDDHNRIAGNIFAELRERLRGKRCEPFMVDMKLKLADSQAFFYPDVLVACDPADNEKYFRERPIAVFEVLSPDTERTDQREKRLAYAQIPSMRLYVLVAQDKCELTVLRRGQTGPWKEEVITKRTDILRLPELEADIPVEHIYERTGVCEPRK
jgi:Uma2 family endonuclease